MNGLDRWLWGYRKKYSLKNVVGAWISRERVRLSRRREGLQVVRKCRGHKFLGGAIQWPNQAGNSEHAWDCGYVSGPTKEARQLECTTVIADFRRQSFEMPVDRGLVAINITQVLGAFFVEHGRPACLVMLYHNLLN